MSGFTLLPLDCPTCGSAVAAEGDDVVYYCVSCRNGYRLKPELDGLEPVEVAFVATPARAAEAYRPFWLLPASVAIHDRQAAGGAFSGLMNFFLGDQRGAGGAAPGEGTFAIPAFDAPIGNLVELALRYTLELPNLGEKLGERLTGGRFSVEDAEKLAHYALVAAEARKPDTLKALSYTIEFSEPRLLGVPFVRSGGGWADALFGLVG